MSSTWKGAQFDHGGLPVQPPKGVMFGRAVRRRCPVCGGGPLFAGWFRMADHCPSCGIRTRRGEDGYTLGALWFNLFLAELITMSVFVTTLVRTWPNPPWDVLQVLGPVEAVVAPLVLWPFARTLFLAFDLCFRPLETKDLPSQPGLEARRGTFGASSQS